MPYYDTEVVEAIEVNSGDVVAARMLCSSCFMNPICRNGMCPDCLVD